MKFWMMSPKIFPLPTILRMLSRVLMEVTKSPTLQIADLEWLQDDQGVANWQLAIYSGKDSLRRQPRSTRRQEENLTRWRQPQGCVRG